MFVQYRMHTERLFAIHGHHFGRGERGSLSSSFTSVSAQAECLP